MKYYMVFVCFALTSFNFKSNCLPNRQTDNRCKDQPNGTFLNHPLGCKYFFVCFNGEVNMGTCPDGQAFSTLRPPCDSEANVDCSESTSSQPTTIQSTTTQITTTEATTTTRPPTTTPSTTTISTTVSTTTQSTTRPTTASSTTTPTASSSTSPSTSRPTTTIPPSTTQRTTSTTITNTQPPTTTTVRPQLTTTTESANTDSPEVKICPVQDDPNQIVFLASNSHCSKYYICYHNQPIEMTCSPNLHWNLETQKCDSIKEAKCTVSTMPSFFPVCPRDAIGMYPHPLNCEWFLYCYLGHMTVQQCPFYFNWDRETQSCQLKTVAKCVLYSE